MSFIPMEEKPFFRSNKLKFTTYYLLLFIPLIVSDLFSQSTDLVNKMREAFQSFRYEKVIFMADSVIVNSPDLEKVELLEIYRLKAVSHYSIGQQPYSELAFKSMLQIDSNYVLDPAVNAPKIIRLYKTIKQAYKPIIKIDKFQTVFNDSIRQKGRDYMSATGRSIIFPGWGHTYLEQEKGKWFMVGSAVLIPLSVYFTAASWHYERKYLDEIDVQKIESRFNKYDKVYQTRNLVLSAYLVYWIYTQYDFFNQSDEQVDDPSVVIYISPTEQQQLQLCLQLSF